MSTTFEQVWKELLGQVKHLDPYAAQKFANRAYSDICDRREWGFLRVRGVLQCPAVISTGTVSVTQYSDDITFSVAASLVLDATNNPAITLRQLKVGGLPYNILEYAPGGAANLDRPYQEATNATAPYELLRCYFTAPSDDFVRFISIQDFTFTKTIKTGSGFTQTWLDHVDPQRSNAGEPLYLCTGHVDSAGNPTFEMWPHPTSAQSYVCTYRKRGAELTNTDTLPPAMPVDLVIARAKYRAYEWAEANKGTHASLQKTNWFGLMAAAQVEYSDLLKQAIKQDREAFPDSLILQRTNHTMDGEWMQSHAPSWSQ